jgi:hypothetical protein
LPLFKQKLIEAPLLRTSNERLPYEVVTDASDLGLGGVLLQEGHHVAFESRKLNSSNDRKRNVSCCSCSSCVALLSGRCKIHRVY